MRKETLSCKKRQRLAKGDIHPSKGHFTRVVIVTILESSDSMTSQRFLVAFLACITLAALGAISDRAFSYELSADTLMAENGEKQRGKIYIKGEKYRIQRQGDPEYIILRHDKNVMWVVVPDEKVYVEMPLDPKKTPKIQEKNPGEISRKLIGPEVIDGHPTNKYEITVKEGSRTETFYQWTATDLDFPIKTSAVKGEWSVEFMNIKSNVPDSVFRVPEDYERAKVVLKPGPEAKAENESQNAKSKIAK